MTDIGDLARTASFALQLWDRMSGEGRTRRAIEAIRQQEIDEVYVEVATLKRRVKGLEEEMDKEPELKIRAVVELQEATFGAGPTKRVALRRLTYRRFDPRFPRDTREVWFDRAKDLKDHEIHGLLLLAGSAPITYFAGFPTPGRRWPQHGPSGVDELAWTEAECRENHTILFYLASKHADLVSLHQEERNDEEGVMGFESFRLTEHGKRLVEAMKAYDGDLVADSDAEDRSQGQRNPSSQAPPTPPTGSAATT